MKILCSLIFVFLFLVSGSSMARVENDIFIKVKLQHVEFQNLLVEKRYKQRRFAADIISMDENFDPSSLEHIERLKGEYKNLLNFKEYMHSIVTSSSVANKIDDIFEMDYSKKLDEYGQQLVIDTKTEKIMAMKDSSPQIQKVEVVSKWVYFFAFLLGIVFIAGAFSYFSLKEKLMARVRKLKRTAFKEKVKVKAYRFSKEKNFYITKGDKVVYNSSRFKKLPNLKKKIVTKKKIISKY